MLYQESGLDLAISNLQDGLYSSKQLQEQLLSGICNQLEQIVKHEQKENQQVVQKIHALQEQRQANLDNGLQQLLEIAKEKNRQYDALLEIATQLFE